MPDLCQALISQADHNRPKTVHSTSSAELTSPAYGSAALWAQTIGAADQWSLWASAGLYRWYLVEVGAIRRFPFSFLPMATLLDLLAFCKSQARIESRDYIDKWAQEPLHSQQVSAWRRDCRLRDSARKACFLAFPGRLHNASEELIPGNYGRLSISESGECDYTIGQYAPREIYGALLFYLEATN